MNVRYRVELSQAERGELSAMLSGGKHAARKLKRAQILLAADAGSGDEEIARAVAVGGSTVYRTKRRFVEGNLERALSEEPRPGAERKLTSKEEALLVATACASPPDGRARWTLALLAGAMVKLTDHQSLSSETVRRRLAENGLKPWRKDMWCIPRSTANTSRAWKTCSTSTPKRPIPNGRWSVSTKLPSSSSERCASPLRPSPASSNATITSTAATVPSISSSSSTRIGRGARSRSPNGAPPKTMPTACANSSRSTIPMPPAFASCRTTCRFTRSAPSTRPLHRPKPGASCAAWNSTTLPSMPAGSTWSRSRSGCSAASAWTAESTIQNGSATRPPHGSGSETKHVPASNGCSLPIKPVPRWAALTGERY
jgi:transposase